VVLPCRQRSAPATPAPAPAAAAAGGEVRSGGQSRLHLDPAEAEQGEAAAAPEPQGAGELREEDAAGGGHGQAGIRGRRPALHPVRFRNLPGAEVGAMSVSWLFPGERGVLNAENLDATFAASGFRS